MSPQPILGAPSVAKLWYLRRCPLFAGFSREEMDEVQRLTQMRRYAKGEMLYLPGQPGEELFLLKSGAVKISRLTPDGHELTLALLKPGDVFGELEVVEEEPRDTQAAALGDVMLCLIRKHDLLRWMDSKPALVLRITKLIGFRRHVIEQKITQLLFRPAPAKIAGLLLDLAGQFGLHEAAGTLIDLLLTHQELANLTGSARETVSYLLSEFRRDGWIAMDRRRIRLLNMAALQQTARTS